MHRSYDADHAEPDARLMLAPLQRAVAQHAVQMEHEN